MPASAITLIDRSLAKVTHQSSGGAIMIAVGALLAIWSLTGAMKTLIWALNIAHDVPERRGFLRTRIAAIAMLACAGTAFVLVFVLLVLGPQLSNWIGAAVDQPAAVSWTWWTVQWPVLVGGAPYCVRGVSTGSVPTSNGPPGGWSRPGRAALTLWLALSGGFA